MIAIVGRRREVWTAIQSSAMPHLAVVTHGASHAGGIGDKVGALPSVYLLARDRVFSGCEMLRLPLAAAPRRLLLSGIAAVFTATLPLQAQERAPVEAVRAINVARTRAVAINGGLQVYRPARCMFATAAPSNPCIVSSGSDGFLFRFLGGPPTWEEKNLPPTVETEIRVSPDGRQVEQVIFNGPPR